MTSQPYTAATFVLAMSALLAMLAFFAGIWAWRSGDPRWGEAARRAVIGLGITLSVCAGALVTAFLTDRFDLEYVAYNSNRTMAAFYKFSAFWGSLDGSMLLWAWLLSLFGAVAMVRHRESDPELLPLVASVFGAILAFFTLTILVSTNPFSPLVGPDGVPFVPPDGLGLNPLLQNPGMVFHPPSLYLGFTGFTVPFAFAIAALVTGRLDAQWVRTSRRWTLVAWIFLTMGNLIGANWAYVELGWGGYWGWDPVENSALMPWFTGTAFVHSVIIQEKKGMLKIWNVSLIMVTFWLTIFGTFLTRSGVVSSVHAFSNGVVGPLFLGFLAVAVLSGLGLLAWRWDKLTTSRPLSSPWSREGAFVLNNWILVGLLFATFWGTVFPVLNEIVVGQRITVGAPFFNRVNAPLGMILLALMGLGPLFSWGRMKLISLRRNLAAPLTAGAVTLVAALAAGVRAPYALASFALSMVVVVAVAAEVWRGVAARRARLGESWATGLWRLINRNRRRYGGYIVHLGVVMIFVGISGNLFGDQAQVIMRQGDRTEFRGYSLELQRIEHRTQRNYDSQLAIFRVTDNSGLDLTMWPERRTYRGGRQENSTEVAILSRFTADLYLILLNEVPGPVPQAVFRFHYNPLVQSIWLGGLVAVLGGIVALGYGRPRRSTAANPSPR